MQDIHKGALSPGGQFIALEERLHSPPVKGGRGELTSTQDQLTPFLTQVQRSLLLNTRDL